MPVKLEHPRLTPQTQKFVDVYDGNVQDAAEIAGLSYAYCRQLMMDLTSPNSEPMAVIVQQAIKKRGSLAKKAIASRERRQKLWTEFLENVDLSPTERMRASELLGKSEGDFLDVKVDLTPNSLADIAAITASRKRKRIASKELDESEGKKDDE